MGSFSHTALPLECFGGASYCVVLYHPLVPCGASLHALISDLDAAYMPEAARLHTEPSHCAHVCVFLASPAMTKLGPLVYLQTELLTTGQSAIWSPGLKTAVLMACKVTVMHINGKRFIGKKHKQTGIVCQVCFLFKR